MPRKRRLGRPTKLTPKLVYDLTRVLAAGAPRRDACRYAGITLRTFREWRRLGREEPRKVVFGPCVGPIPEDGKPLWNHTKPFTYGDFLHRVQEADTALVIRAAVSLTRNLESDGRLALMVLERLRPEPFARKEVIQATATALPGMPPGARVATPRGGYKLTLEVVKGSAEAETEAEAEDPAVDREE